jgi:DNA primase
MSSQVEQIKEKLGIVDVVSQYVKLEKAGSNFRARCPFHNEKTPSFFVSPTRNSYYCFGCNAKGDVFSFVEAFEGLDFVGALKVLGEKAGVQIVFENKQDKDEKSRLYSVMEEAIVFFVESLKKNTEVQKYLKDRGLEGKTVTDWRIGYAGDSWSSLYDHLKKTYSVQEIEKVGLIKKKEGGAEYYDRFRGRIMFPIFDNSGRVVAFSGRIFKDDEKSAKYINSPETVLFSKSKILYGYDRAKFSIRKLNFSIVVEGQMDLLMSHQAGFTNTVALSGTALTGDHIGLLKRLSENIVLAFDSDKAGVASSGKSAVMGLQSGMDVKVTHLKDGEDPADVIKKDLSADKAGKEEWKGAIRDAKHIVEFSLNILLETVDDKRKLLLEASKTVLPYIARISNKIDQEHFISIFAGKLGLSDSVVREELSKIPDDIKGQVEEHSSTTVSPKEKLNKKDSIKDKIAGILIWQKSLRESAIDIEKTEKELERIMGKEKSLHLTQKQDNIEELLFEVEKIHENDERLDEEVGELLSNLEQEYLKEEMERVSTELRSVEANDAEDKKIDELTKKHKELSDKLSNLEDKGT